MPTKFKAELGVKASHADGADCNADAPYEDAECNTLKLSLSKPAPYFHTIMGIWVAYPAKEELISEGGENWWNSSKYQIGNGPFILTSLEPFVRGAFTPNANYWGDKPTYDLEYSYITDTAVAFEAYKNDEFDIVISAAEDLKAIEADPVLKAEHMVYPGSCTTVIKMGLAGEVQGSGGQGVSDRRSSIPRCARRSPTRSTRKAGPMDVDQRPVDPDLDLDPARVPWV